MGGADKARNRVPCPCCNGNVDVLAAPKINADIAVTADNAGIGTPRSPGTPEMIG